MNELIKSLRAITPSALMTLEERVEKSYDEAVTIVIQNQDSLTLANEKSLNLKAIIKEIDDTFKPLYDADKAKAALTKETWDRFRIPPDTEYRRIKADIGRFLEEQEKIRRNAEIKAWHAEQERIKAEEEEKRIIAEAVKKVSIADARGEEEKVENILKEAGEKRIEIAKKIEDANKTIGAPIPIQPKTMGISAREDWDIELIDINLVPREYLMFDEVKARKVVRTSKGTILIPGIRNIKKTIISQR